MPGLFPPSVVASVPAQRRKSFPSEKAASIWHSPNSGLAQSTGPRFKATHTLESKQGAILISKGAGGFCGRVLALPAWALWGLCPKHLGRLLSFSYCDASVTIPAYPGPSSCPLSISAKPWPQQQSYQRVSHGQLDNRPELRK